MDVKTPVKSAIVTYKLAMPQDSNPAPGTDLLERANINGGSILHLIDNTCGIAALRHCRTRVVTASIDRMEFLNPVKVGDLIIVKASVNWVGRTSMEVGCRVEVEDLFTGEVKQVGRAYLTFVAINEEGRPINAPPIKPESEDEERRYEQAQDRRKGRLAHRELMMQKYDHKVGFDQ